MGGRLASLPKNILEQPLLFRMNQFCSDVKRTQQLMADSVATKDESPLAVGEEQAKQRKPRHPRPKPPSVEPAVDFSSKSVLLFPGQGFQFVGMGKKVLEIPTVKELFSDASQVLGYDLLKLCLEGPKSMLDETKYCQAATVVSSLAAVECLYEKDRSAVENCMAVAGFSVGELTALIFTGAITFSEGISLVKIRGEAMQAACELERSGMATVFVGADNKLSFGLQVAEEWCKRHHSIESPVCKVANHLYCGAKVVGGHVEALNFLEKNKDDFKIRKIKRLPVSGAFHTALMEPAVVPFREAMKTTKINNPRVPIYSNVDNIVLTYANQVMRYLPRQITHAVRWESSMSRIFSFGPNDLLPSVYECGPGKSLSSILEKVNGRAARKCQYVSV